MKTKISFKDVKKFLRDKNIKILSKNNYNKSSKDSYKSLIYTCFASLGLIMIFYSVLRIKGVH